MSEQQSVVIRDYQVNIRAILQEAWQKNAGVKWTIIASLLIILSLSLVLTFIMSYALHLPFGGQKGAWSSVIIPKLTMIPLLPLVYGVGLLGIYVAGGLPISIKLLYQQYKRFLPLFFYFLILSGLALIFDGVSLMVNSVPLVVAALILQFMVTFVLMMTPWLILEKNCDVLVAMKTSIMGIKQHWLKVFVYLLTLIPIVIIPFILSLVGLALQSMLLVSIGVIVALVSYVWILPTITIATGIIYREMFGVTAK